jgi:hypothetical protein
VSPFSAALTTMGRRGHWPILLALLLAADTDQWGRALGLVVLAVGPAACILASR